MTTNKPSGTRVVIARAAVECIDPPPPCSCGSLELWQDVKGVWHCQHCHPSPARRLLALKAEIGKRPDRRRSSRRVKGQP